eukprot:3932981-Pleurochrysis_carterae.AAC.1
MANGAGRMRGAQRSSLTVAAKVSRSKAEEGQCCGLGGCAGVRRRRVSLYSESKESRLGGRSLMSIGTMRSAHSVKSAADDVVSASRASRSAATADAAVCSAASAGAAAESVSWSREDSAAAGMAPKEKALASHGVEKSASMPVGRTRASTATAARVAALEAGVPTSAASVHHPNTAPLRSALRLCPGVRTRSAWGISTGTGATARRGPWSYSPAKKQARPPIVHAA